MRLILCLFFILLQSCTEAPSDKSLRISAAASMQYTIKALTAAFTEKYNIPCETIIGSSGKLTAQINEGAPYDIFISANALYPKVLYENNKTMAPPTEIAKGKLVIWSLQSRKTLIDLMSHELKHIAIANPKVAPYGTATLEVFQNFPGLYEQIEPKLVYGENIAQVNQFVATGVAELGLTALSSVIALQENQKSYWTEIEGNHHEPILHTMVLLKNHRHKEKEAKRFSEFVQSPEGKTILEKYGYIVD